MTTDTKPTRWRYLPGRPTAHALARPFGPLAECGVSPEPWSTGAVGPNGGWRGDRNPTEQAVCAGLRRCRRCTQLLLAKEDGDDPWA